jgi:hypothetical protein
MVDFVQKCEISEMKLKKQQWERRGHLYQSEGITQDSECGSRWM